MSRPQGRKWDGISRIPSQKYKDEYDRIFGKKENKNKRQTKNIRKKS
jgi:hypothetical protein